MAKTAPKLIKYDTIVRGTNYQIPVAFKLKDSATGEIKPYNLSGKLLFLTVKENQYDGIRPASSFKEDLEKWKDALMDKTAALSDFDGWNYDFLFRIMIDCDDLTSGENGPQGNFDPDADLAPWQDNYQGMYGVNPELGEATFRLSKKMTMINPGSYFFDVRIMEKDMSQIGEISENRNFAPIFGTFEIFGTPTNRTQYNWIRK